MPYLGIEVAHERVTEVPFVNVGTVTCMLNRFERIGSDRVHPQPEIYATGEIAIVSRQARERKSWVSVSQTYAIRAKRSQCNSWGLLVQLVAFEDSSADL
jgi:hypothetical protein